MSTNQKKTGVNPDTFFEFPDEEAEAALSPNMQTALEKPSYDELPDFLQPAAEQAMLDAFGNALIFEKGGEASSGMTRLEAQFVRDMVNTAIVNEQTALRAYGRRCQAAVERVTKRSLARHEAGIEMLGQRTWVRVANNATRNPIQKKPVLTAGARVSNHRSQIGLFNTHVEKEEKSSEPDDSVQMPTNQDFTGFGYD